MTSKKIIYLLILILASPLCSTRSGKLPNSSSENRIGITDTEIKIGTSVPLSGHAASLGIQLTQGSLSLIKEINSKGGIHGRKLSIIILDDQYEPDKTLQNTQKLIKENKVFILFDYVGTPTSKAIVRIINDEKIPILGLFTGAEFLRNPVQPYIINIRASYFNEVEYIIDRWIAEGKKKIAVFLQDDAFGYAVLAGTELALARYNMETTATARFKRGKLPDEEQVEIITNAGVDAVVMVGTSRSLATFVKIAKERGLHGSAFHTVSFVGSNTFAKDLLSHGKDTAQNVYVSQVVPSPYNTDNATVKEYIELYKKYYPAEKPNYVALEGFINAKILIESFNRCGKNLNRSKFIEICENMSDYNAGIGLPSKIDKYDHSFFHKVYLSSLREGKFKTIE